MRSSSSGSSTSWPLYQIAATTTPGQSVAVFVKLANDNKPFLLPLTSSPQTFPGLVEAIYYVRGQGKDSPLTDDSIFQLANHFNKVCPCEPISGLSAPTTDNLWKVDVSFDFYQGPNECNCTQGAVSEISQTITIRASYPPAVMSATVTLDPSASLFVAAGGMFITGVSPDGKSPQVVRVLPGHTVTISVYEGTFTLDPTGYSPQKVTLSSCPTSDGCASCPNFETSWGQVPCTASWSLLTTDGQWTVSAGCSGIVFADGFCTGWLQTSWQVTIAPVGPGSGSGVGGRHHVEPVHHAGPSVVEESHRRQTPWGAHRLGSLLH
jgi:hypothetical protein